MCLDVLVIIMLLSCRFLGKSCSFGQPYMFFVLCIFVILLVSHFGFEDGTEVLMAPVPGHYSLLTFLYPIIFRFFLVSVAEHTNLCRTWSEQLIVFS